MSLSPLSISPLNRFDYVGLSESTLPQNKLVYASIIASRILAAKNRSRNEVREHLLRDSLGWSFWFYTTPIVTRAYLKLMAPELLSLKPMPTGNSLWQKMQQLAWKFNPIARYDVIGAAQLELRQAQVLKAAAALEKPAEALTETLISQFKHLRNQRNFATGLGTVISIIMMGLFIPSLNILMTQRRVAAAKASQQQNTTV